MRRMGMLVLALSLVAAVEAAKEPDLTLGEKAALAGQRKRLDDLEQKLRARGLGTVDRARLQMELYKAAQELRRMESAPKPAASPAK